MVLRHLGIIKKAQHVLCSTSRRVVKMPDPYRESYKPYLDPVPVAGFFLVTIPLAWITYDIVFETDKEIQPKYTPPSSRKQVRSGLNDAQATDSKKLQPKIQLPKKVQHVIIGAGAAGMAAARAIRASDPRSCVLLIAGDESCGELGLAETNQQAPPPYVRPLLSKGLWWRTPERRAQMLNPEGDIRKHSWLYFEPLSFFIDPEKLSETEEGGVCFLRGNPVVALHPDRHTVCLADGQEIAYSCCLIATGAQPRRMPELEHCSISGADLIKARRITYFRNLSDYRHLQAVSDRLHKEGGRIAIVGSGPLASELAVSISGERQLTKEEKEAKTPKDTAEFGVHHFLGFKSVAPMQEILPPVLADAVSSFESKKRVTVAPATSVVRASLVNPKDPANSQLRLTVHRREDGGVIKEDKDVIVDHIVCAIGADPRTELAASAGLEVDSDNGGFLVNSELESRADIYVAGDAASYWDSQLCCRRRMEHLNFAEESGTLAGLNMARSAGSSEPSSSDASLPPEKTYDPLSSVHEFQPSFWCSLGTGAAYDCVGVIDSKRLITRTVFIENENADSCAVVFYLKPNDHRLVGVLLWNLPEDLFEDSEFAAPSRLNFARKLLADQTFLRDNNEVLTLAQKFDMGGEIAESYAELKAYVEAKKAEEAAEVEDSKKAEEAGTSS
ncbi:unnamed protein product [Mesocestoides corti]|uniref:FAD/NAD(P)-binding domain-containing protein n=1 Tax=Mesocestoides corti TaxID=53468 RepID=A0A0R3UL88_MESCO|nr:unnamed protein product [Mesocestoides corti]